MKNLMPNSNAEQIEKELENTLFKNPQVFIQSFNDKVIDSRNPKMIDLAERIEKAYKNIALDKKEREFTFISKEEVYLKDLNIAISDWTVLARIQREVEEHLEDFSDKRLYFPNKGRNTGFLYAYLGEVEEDGEVVPDYKKISKEKAITSKSDLERLVGAEHVSEEEDFVIIDSVDSVINLDDSFVKRLYESLPESYKN